MKYRLLTLLVALLPLGLAVEPASASLRARSSMGESLLRLSADAELIVTGRVVGVSNIYSPPAGYLRQAPRVQVTRVLKGAYGVGKDLTFLYRRDSQRGYRPREEVLLFLSSRPLGDAAGSGAAGRWFSIVAERSKIPILPTNRQAVLNPVAHYVRLAAGGTDATELRKTLVEDARSESRWVARDALDELLARPRLVDALTEDEMVQLRRTAYRSESDPYVRDGVIRFLRNHPDGDRHLLILIEAMRDEWFRRQLIDAVVYRNLTEALVYVLPDLESANAPLRAAAVRAVGVLGHAGQIESLEERAWRDPILAIEGLAVRAIARIGGAAAYDFLGRVSREHPNPRIRELAARQSGATS
ncbi:MAG: hypothetical protein KC466_21510 [Myxococcales bacterium]|nr:hypothetical protein [Myxococcales bacterium]